MNHEAAGKPEGAQCLSQQPGIVFGSGTDNLYRRPGWVGERSQQVKHRPHFELPADRLHVPCRDVICGRKEKRDADFTNRAGCLIGWEIDPDPHCFQ